LTPRAFQARALARLGYLGLSLCMHVPVEKLAFHKLQTAARRTACNDHV
jgi:hypothetical protein